MAAGIDQRLHRTSKRAVDIPAPPLPVSRGSDVKPEVHVVCERGDDAVLPAPVTAVAVLNQGIALYWIIVLES